MLHITISPFSLDSFRHSLIHPAMGLEIKELSSTVGLMDEPETKMRTKPKPRAKPGIEQRRDLGKVLCETHTYFENLNLKLYNLAIVEVKINNYQ